MKPALLDIFLLMHIFQKTIHLVLVQGYMQHQSSCQGLCMTTRSVSAHVPYIDIKYMYAF